MKVIEYLMIIIAVVVTIYFGLLLITLYDNPTFISVDRQNNIEYITTINNTLNGSERIEIAKAICEKVYGKNGEINQKIIGEFFLSSDIVDSCIDDLLKLS